MRKNILIFCHGYAAPFIDVNNQYTTLFHPEKYHVTVVYLVGEPNEIVMQKHLAKNIIFLNSPKRSTRGLKIFAIKKMLQLQREYQFQIVICHRYKPTHIMLWVTRFCHVPLILSVMHEFKTMSAFTRKLAILFLAKKNVFFVGVSNAIREDLRKDLWWIAKERIITLYNMIDIAATESELLDRNKARQALNFSPADFIFGTIGRLVKAKDQQSLVTAFAAIHEKCPNAKLIIIGTGELENTLKQQIQALHLSNHVFMLGYLDKAFKYMKAFDVFILPSIKEAFGRVLLEAMTAKVPIIATKINGIPEVIENTGILVPPSHPPILAKEMLNLYDQSKEKLIECGALGYQRASDLFTLLSFYKIFWDLPFFQCHQRDQVAKKTSHY